MAKPLHRPALDPSSLEPSRQSSYPAPYRDAVAGRLKRVLGDPLGLTHFGVNLVELPPGGASSQRHWHTHEDEFVYVLSGELTLVTEDGEQVLEAGTVAGFPAGVESGHHLLNRGTETAVYLEVGDRRPESDECHYPDVDLFLGQTPAGLRFVHKDGTPYDDDS